MSFQMPPANASRIKLHTALLTDLGRARDHQEDAAIVVTPADPVVRQRRGDLLIVADGMGGHNAGEVASQAALEEIRRAYYADVDSDIPAALFNAIQAANQAVYQLSFGDISRSGMGTTAAVAVMRGSDVHVANVGDSRVYLLRENGITQITQDHSWVAEQMRAGTLTPEQAKSHPQRNIITRALGSGPTVEPDLFVGQLHGGDGLLLCSDGLTGHVDEAELLAVVNANPPEQAAQQLVDLANERGGSDNISVIIARAEAQDVAAGPLKSGRWPANRLALGLVVLLIILIVGFGLVAAWLLRRSGAPPAPLPTATITALLATATSTETLASVAAEPPSSTATPTFAPTATLASTAKTEPRLERSPPPETPEAVKTPESSVTPLPAPLLAPKQLSPGDGDTAPSEITFDWRPVIGAAGYLVQTRSEQFGQTKWRGQPVEKDGVAQFRLVFDRHPDCFAVPGTEYFWRVAALDAAGQASASRRFIYQCASVSTTATPTSGPELQPITLTLPPTQAPTSAPGPTDTPAPPTVSPSTPQATS